MVDRKYNTANITMKLRSGMLVLVMSCQANQETHDISKWLFQLTSVEGGEASHEDIIGLKGIYHS